tara:strand:- start:333 stop:605 length:273 start_codon:yes stop_codon:yes gene_type:complete
MEDQEEKQGPGIIGNAVQLVILGWSLAVISWSYFNPNPIRQIDTTFAAGLLSAVMSNYGLNVKKATDKKKVNGNVKIVDNSKSKVGIEKK